MELRTVVEAGGEEVTYKYYDGVHFPVYVPGDCKDRVDSVLDMKYKDGDVLIASYPKAGTHWMYDILHMLINGKNNFEEIFRILDFEAMESIDMAKTPRHFATHFYPKHLPKEFLKNKGKLVYVYRNPKDSAVSFYTCVKRLNAPKAKNYNGKWEDFIENYSKGKAVYNSWFEHAKAWQKFMMDNPDYPVFVISFEEMKKDLRSSIGRLADFIGVEHESTFLDEVTRRCEFISVIQEKTNMSDKMKDISRDGKNPFYRKGEVGDWRNWFTVAQNELFDKRHENDVSAIDLPVRYTL
ncbi:sulfotransferase family cytosolic 1B member 1-like [Mizuhopecten yessoensis]|uniref:Sulfotransferase 1C4 n=1 Tax=Mizuhopecten yessoensis TaxID=6573 RepID=A0A210Q5X8_MIZYE|nr:sulfotransferase family cytosolic 1B member 1-like [Mizuhopecten yessoensis]OWF44128.1 Sulfotransferase 1C4 [Mizuhopecten yessoensis]